MNALDELLLSKYRESVLDPPQRLSKTSDPAPTESIEVTAAVDVDGTVDDPGMCDDGLTANAEVEAVAVAESVADIKAEVERDPASESTSQVEVRIESNNEVGVVNGEEAAEVTIECDAESEQESRPTTLPFRPEWEVDRFLWPAICTEVEGRIEKALQSALGQVRRECGERDCNIVALAGTSPGAGCTTMTLCFAREAAKQGLKVAVVDLNHENPMVMDQLGVAFEEGIESLQKDGVTPDSICVAALEDGVALVPLIEAVEFEYCHSQMVQHLVEVVSANHDLVLIDASQELVNSLATCNAFGKVGVILVTDEQTREQQHEPDNETNGEKTWTLGVIENFAA